MDASALAEGGEDPKDFLLPCIFVFLHPPARASLSTATGWFSGQKCQAAMAGSQGGSTEQPSPSPRPPRQCNIPRRPTPVARPSGGDGKRRCSCPPPPGDAISRFEQHRSTVSPGRDWGRTLGAERCRRLRSCRRAGDEERALLTAAALPVVRRRRREGRPAAKALVDYLYVGGAGKSGCKGGEGRRGREAVHSQAVLPSHCLGRTQIIFKDKRAQGVHRPPP